MKWERSQLQDLTGTGVAAGTIPFVSSRADEIYASAAAKAAAFSKAETASDVSGRDGSSRVAQVVAASAKFASKQHLITPRQFATLAAAVQSEILAKNLSLVTQVINSPIIIIS